MSRNLAEFPITYQEKMDWLNAKLLELPTGMEAPVGDLTGLIIAMIMVDVGRVVMLDKEEDEWFKTIEERVKAGGWRPAWWGR